MNDIKNEFGLSIQKGFIKQIADKVLQSLEKLENAPSYMQKRWIWELIQNAKDVKNRFGKVSIRIEIFENEMVFSHNGDPFTVDQLTSLIQQVSSKDDSLDGEETTGKFGTGFITTHLISALINVSGVVVDSGGNYRRFTIPLDRSGKSSSELIPKIEKAIDIVLNDGWDSRVIADYEYKRKEEDFDTKFRYPVDEKSRIIISEGINDLDISLPFTLSFNESIANVSVIDNTKGISITFNKKEHEIVGEDGENSRIVIDKIINDHDIKEIRVVTYNSDDITLAFPYENLKKENNTQEKSYLLPLGDETPRLFRDFPLVGSHTFDFPCIMNCKKFFPKEERDGLLLKDSSNEKVQINRKAIEKAANLTIAFVKTGLKNPVENLHLYCFTKVPKPILEIDDPAAKNWFIESVQEPLRKELMILPILKNSKGQMILPESSKIPYLADPLKGQNEKFWSLCNIIISDYIPDKESHNDWIGILKNEKDSWKNEMRFQLSDLLKLIEDKVDLKDFGLIVQNYNVVEFINDIIEFIIDRKEFELLNEYKIIPNKNGVFCKYKDLEEDNINQDRFLDVLGKLGKDWKNELKHPDIFDFKDMKKRSLKQFSDTINEIIKNIDFKDESSEESEALFTFSGYLISERATNHLLIYRIAKKLFQEELATSPLYFPGTDDLNREPIKKWLLRKIMIEIEKTVNLRTLTSKHNLELDQDIELISKLSNFIKSQEDYKYLLDKYRILPNQYGDFSYVADLYNDSDNISDELKNILHSLNSSEDWKSLLINTKIEFNTGKNKTLGEITSLIEDEVEQRKKNDEIIIIKKEVLRLINILKINPAKYESHFKWLSERKAQLLLELMDEGSDRENIFKIMESGKDLSQIALIVNSDFNLENISKISEAEELLGKDRLYQSIEELLEERRDFLFKKRIGSDIEDQFKAILEEQGLPVTVKLEDFSQDLIVYNNSGLEYRIEIKSISPTHNSVLMGRQQVKSALERKTSYCLCVIIRDRGSQTLNMENMYFIVNIGDKLEDFRDFSEELDEKIYGNSDIKIFLKDNEYKFIIKKEIWQTGRSFQNFISYLDSYFRAEN